MSIIRGQDMAIYIGNNRIACWRSCTLQVTADIIGKSTVGSGNWKEFDGQVLSWTITGEGLIEMDALMTIHDVYDLMITLQPVFVIFELDPGVVAVYYYGEAIITQIQEQGNVNDLGNFNISMQGTGELGKGNNVVYGNYPLLFQIIEVSPDEPSPGSTTLDFVWNAAIPEEDLWLYRIKVHDVTADTEAFEDTPIGDTSHTKAIVVNSTHSYEFSIQTLYFDGFAQSESSPVITWP